MTVSHCLAVLFAVRLTAANMAPGSADYPSQLTARSRSVLHRVHTEYELAGNASCVARDGVLPA